jgi:succinate-semialdehyde dehydrogenase/glutarate-semialdehyde dehydrogenase
MYIDGKWMDSTNENTHKLINPATEEMITEIPMATMEEINLAIKAAEKGWKKWRNIDAWSRSEVLRKVAYWIRTNIQLLARILTEEQGKPLAEAKGELNATADQYDWYADEARRIYGRTIEGHTTEVRLSVIKQPIGVVAAFSPWNFPYLLSSRKIAPAIAAGCSIIVKADIYTPRSVLMIAKAFEESNLPPGVLNVITGNSAMISEQLCKSSIIRKITLTGSIPVGQILLRQAAENIIPVTMELGGHSPFVVFEDVDVQKVAEIAAKAKYRNNGQVCISASRFYVHESIAKEFIQKFIEVTKTLKIGNGLEDGIDIGPLGNGRRVNATIALIEDALAKGAKLEYGGKIHPDFAKGYFFEPTVITNVNSSMKIMNEEPFCPIAPISTFKDLDDAIEKANSTDFGLAAYIFTNNLRTATLASEQIEAGMVGINDVALATAEIPFGGVKKSGFGREGGSEGISEYVVEKYIRLKI